MQEMLINIKRLKAAAFYYIYDSLSSIPQMQAY